MSYLYISEMNDIKFGIFSTPEQAAKDIAITACGAREKYETLLSYISEKMPEAVSDQLQLPEIIQDLYVLERTYQTADSKVSHWRVLQYDTDQVVGEHKSYEPIYSSFAMKYGSKPDWLVTRALLDTITELKSETQAKETIATYLDFQKIKNRTPDTDFMAPESAVSKKIAEQLTRTDVTFEDVQTACLNVFDHVLNAQPTLKP